MATRTPSAGRGSNQYQRRGASTRIPRTVEDARSLLEVEQAAWAFAADDTVPADHRRSKSYLARMSAHPDAKVRREAASKKGCPPAVLAVLADDEDSDVVAAVAQNPSTPPEVLYRLAEQSVSERVPVVAAKVVGNPSAPSEVFDLVFNPDDKPLDKRWHLSSFMHPAARVAARNPACPERYLERFAAHPSFVGEVLANPDCPVELLRHYAVHGGNNAAQTALAHPRCPENVLRSAVKQRWAHAPAALSNPNCPEDLLERAMKIGTQAEAAANNPNLPRRLWEQAARSVPDSRAARHVAADPDTSPETLTYIANYAGAAVQAKVAANPSCPDRTIKSLFRLRSLLVDRALAQNPATPDSLLRALVRRGDSITAKTAKARLP